MCDRASSWTGVLSVGLPPRSRRILSFATAISATPSAGKRRCGWPRDARGTRRDEIDDARLVPVECLRLNGEAGKTASSRPALLHLRNPWLSPSARTSALPESCHHGPVAAGDQTAAGSTTRSWLPRSTRTRGESTLEEIPDSKPMRCPRRKRFSTSAPRRRRTTSSSRTTVRKATPASTGEGRSPVGVPGTGCTECCRPESIDDLPPIETNLTASASCRSTLSSMGRRSAPMANAGRPRSSS